MQDERPTFTAQSVQVQFVILACTIGLIPKVGALLEMPLMIIGFILVVQQRDCVLAIMKERLDRLQPSSAGDVATCAAPEK